MALIEYKRATDVLHLAQDINMEVTDLLYIPLVESFEDLSVGISDPDKPGAIAAYMDGDSVKLAVYNGDGTWSPVGSSSGPTYTPDPSTPNTSALSYLNTTYPNAKPGDQVYKTAGGMRRTWTCYSSGEWSRIDEVIET